MNAGSAQLAAVGVGLSIFSTVTKLLNIPLLSVTTNVVATAVGSDASTPRVPAPHLHVTCKAVLNTHWRDWVVPGNKTRKVGLAASTSLLIAVLVSLAEVRPPRFERRVVLAWWI